MKALALALLCLMAAAPSFAQRTPRPPSREEIDPFPPCRWGHDCRGPGRYPPPRHGGGSVRVSCAPEVVNGNVQATDRVLSGLVAKPEFKDATVFKTEVARIAQLKGGSVKATEYFKMIGIDSTDSQKVFDFVGARQVPSSALAELQRNADLNAQQAELVAVTLRSALKGGLQD